MLTNNRRGFRDLLIPALSILFVSLITLLVKHFAPSPSENVDKMIVALWWVAPFVVLFITHLEIQLPPALSKQFQLIRQVLFGDFNPGRILFYLLTLGALISGVVAVFWDRDSYSLYRGITLTQFSVGLLICAAIYFGFWGERKWVRDLLLVTTIIAVEVLALPTYIQWPGNIADNFHFPFTSDEIAVLSLGHFPYSNFIPQYTAFLGYPVAPFIHLWPTHVPLVITFYLTSLQLACVAIAVALPVMVGGRKILGPALLLAAFPPLLLMNQNLRSITYFAVSPFRLIFPAVAILLTYLWITRVKSTHREILSLLFGLGAFSGLMVLNNLDYGVPAAGAVVLTLFLAQKNWRGRLNDLAIFSAGFASLFLLFQFLGLLLGKTVHWEYLLTFARIFSVENYLAIPIEPFGLHIAVASLFVATTGIGITLLLRSSGAVRFARREGALLTLTGTFSLLSLAYFSSRSLVPTLISGYSFQVGMCCAALLPLLHLSAKSFAMKVTRRARYALPTSIFGLLALAPCAAIILLIGSPSANVSHFFKGGTYLNYTDLNPVTEELVNSLTSPNLIKDPLLFDSSHIWQIVTMPSVVQIETGYPSASLTNSPAYLVLQDPIFRQLQCAALRDNPQMKYLVVERAVSNQIATDPTCARLLDFPGQNLGTSPFDLVLLTRLPGV